MEPTRRRYFKRTHAAARILTGICFFLAVVLGFPVFFLLSNLLEFSSSSLLAREDIAWVMLLVVSPVALVLFGLGVLGFHRGVFLTLEPRTVTVYWGLSLPFGKAWPWRRVGTRSPQAGTPLEVRYLHPETLPPAYTLVLSGADEPLTLFSELEYSDTRDKAEQIALHLELALRDTTQDALAVKAPDAEPPGWRDSRTTSLREGDARVVILPARRPPKHYTQFIVKVLVYTGGVAGISALVPLVEGDKPTALLTVPMTLGALVWSFAEEYLNSLSHVLRGSRNELVVESESFFGRRVRRFSRADVRQVGVVLGVEHENQDSAKTRKVSRLLVRGSNFQLQLGSHLPHAELQARAQELRAALGLEEDTRAAPGRSPGG